MTEVVTAPNLLCPSSFGEEVDDSNDTTKSNNHDWLSFSQNTDIGKLAEELLKRERLVDWATSVLAKGLAVVAHRRRCGDHPNSTTVVPNKPARIPLDEVVDVIDFRHHADSSSVTTASETTIEHLPENIRRLLREFVSVIASTHKMHAYHNFANACQTLMCTAESLSIARRQSGVSPLAALALLFASLIPYVNHPGGDLTNVQISQDQVWLGQHYQMTAVLQQNALDVTWHIFMDAQFDEMRQYMFHSSIQNDEFALFRQVVVNAVMATDDGDNAKARQEREARWKESAVTDSNMRQTVLLEYLLQLSQATPALQDGRTYLRETQLRFDETVLAHQQGRLGGDNYEEYEDEENHHHHHPSTYWYQRELDYLDNMVVPLVRRLREAKVLPHADTVYRNVRRNRCEWKNCGGTYPLSYSE
eukprot:scaffold1252_cov154-Amphora_coffeaeformis.AAC.5